MISPYKELSDGHLELLEVRQVKGVDNVATTDIQNFLSNIVEGSSEIGDPREREHLREMARYWATVIYDRTGEYPSTDLLPGPSRVPERRINFRGLLVVVGIVVIGIVGIQFIRGDGAFPWLRTEPTQTPTVRKTQASTATISPAPEITSTPLTPSPTFDPLTGITIQITSLQESDEVHPRSILNGIYSGLEENRSSIHILLQPLSTGEGKVFPSEEFLLVPDSTGEWELQVRFGDDDALSKVEQYNIRIAFTNDEEARSELVEGRAEGFELTSLPRGITVLRQVITVQRQAFSHIYEDRLLYSFLFSHGDFVSFDIVSAPLKPGRSDDHIRLTSTAASEIQPSLCASNQKIIFVQRKWLVEEEKTGYAIGIMDSDGQNMDTLVDEPDLRYERPGWSPDCRYVAYSVYDEDTEEWYLYVMDYQDVSRQPFKLIEGRYPTWIPGVASYELVFQGSGGIMVIDVGACLETNQVAPSTCPSSLFTETKLEGTQPSISPDRKWLALASAPFLNEELETYNQEILLFNILTEQEPLMLTMDPNRDWWPAWGPDSQTIYFESGRRKKYTIWSISINGNNLQLLTDESNSAQYPYISFQDAFFLTDDDQAIN